MKDSGLMIDGSEACRRHQQELIMEALLVIKNKGGDNLDGLMAKFIQGNG